MYCDFSGELSEYVSSGQQFSIVADDEPRVLSIGFHTIAGHNIIAEYF